MDIIVLFRGDEQSDEAMKKFEVLFLSTSIISFLLMLAIGLLGFKIRRAKRRSDTVLIIQTIAYILSLTFITLYYAIEYVALRQTLT